MYFKNPCYFCFAVCSKIIKFLFDTLIFCFENVFIGANTVDIKKALVADNYMVKFVKHNQS
jgi:hypothetical protein